MIRDIHTEYLLSFINVLICLNMRQITYNHWKILQDSGAMQQLRIRDHAECGRGHSR